MLINIFSLHRSGSTWWTYYIRNQYKNSIFFNEVFNQLNYFSVNEDNTYTPQDTYFDGCFWQSPNEDLTYIVNHYRKITDSDSNRFDNWVKFIGLLQSPVICHTHFSPLQNKKYIIDLADISKKNYYVYRENIHEQLASLSIMRHTKEYMVTDADSALKSTQFEYSIVDKESIKFFINDVKQAEQFMEDNIHNVEYIKYESMPFSETLSGMPLKQNMSAFARLCSHDQSTIMSAIQENYNE
jgi:hypothetical protein